MEPVLVEVVRPEDIGAAVNQVSDDVDLPAEAGHQEGRRHARALHIAVGLVEAPQSTDVGAVGDLGDVIR